MITRYQNGAPDALENVTALNARVVMEQCGRTEDRVVYVRGKGVITGGVIKIEEATQSDYEGVWSLLDEIQAADLSGGGEDGVEVAKHYIGCKFRAFQARIASAITGGGAITLVMD